MPEPVSPRSRRPEVTAIVEALAEKFSVEHGERNKAWDWEKPDGPDNVYYFTRPMSVRMKDSPMTFFTDTDGHRSMRVPSFYELAETIVDAKAVVSVADLGDPALLERVLGASQEYHFGNDDDRATLRVQTRQVLEALAVALNEERCHCGRRVADEAAESPAWRVLCEDCATVRCDAYPGACTDLNPVSSSAS